MNTSSFSVRRPVASGLTIRPPSPGHLIPPKTITPTNPNQPRSYATSPTHSTRSTSTQGVTGRRGSSDTTSGGSGPPVPAKGDKEKKLPHPPWISPSKRGEKGYAGAYDNKLVSYSIQWIWSRAYRSGIIDGITSPTYTPLTHAHRELFDSLESSLLDRPGLRPKSPPPSYRNQETTFNPIIDIFSFGSSWISDSPARWYRPLVSWNGVDGRESKSGRNDGLFECQFTMECASDACLAVIWGRRSEDLH
jgi:hypothetical protein